MTLPASSAVVLVVVAWCVAGAPVEIVAAEQPPQTPAAQHRPPPQGEHADEPAEKPADGDDPALVEKKRVVAGAALMLMGIAFVGVCGIVLLLLWGVRVRRMARKRLPPTTVHDDLWYLKPNKKLPPADRRDDAGGESDEASSPAKP